MVCCPVAVAGMPFQPDGGGVGEGRSRAGTSALRSGHGTVVSCRPGALRRPPARRGSRTGTAAVVVLTAGQLPDLPAEVPLRLRRAAAVSAQPAPVMG